MKRIVTWTTVSMFLIGLIHIDLASAIVLGQLDDFQDGTTQGWTSGVPNPDPPTNVADGGPAGLGDSYLRVASGGGIGPGSRLIASNGSQWTGDYLAAGVTAITADLKNFGNTELEIRLFVDDQVANLFASPLMSVAAVTLPALGDWNSVTFQLSPGDLTGGDFNLTLGNVQTLRIVHDTDTSRPHPAIGAELGADNLRAISGLIPGDLNGDGFVGGDDLDIVRSFWGQAVTPGNKLHGDPSGDGFVGGDDLDEVRAHWGEGTPPTSGDVAEPSTMALLVGVGWCVFWVSRRRRH